MRRGVLTGPLDGGDAVQQTGFGDGQAEVALFVPQSPGAVVEPLLLRVAVLAGPLDRLRTLGMACLSDGQALVRGAVHELVCIGGGAVYGLPVPTLLRVELAVLGEQAVVLDGGSRGRFVATGDRQTLPESGLAIDAGDGVKARL